MSVDWATEVAKFEKWVAAGEGLKKSESEPEAEAAPPAAAAAPTPEQFAAFEARAGKRIAEGPSVIEVRDAKHELLKWEMKKTKRAQRDAERELAAEELLADGTAPPVVRSRSELLALDLGTERWLIPGLFARAGILLLAAFRKAGKTTLVLNFIRSWITRELFLGVFEIYPPAEGNIVWLDCELPETTQQDWVRAISGDAAEDDAAWDRFLAIQARGRLHHLNILSPEGRQTLADMITSRGPCSLLVVDPVGPLMAACGLNPNLDNETEVFIAAVKRVALMAGVSEILMTHHVGKASSRDEGHETARGSGVWEGAVDSIVVAGRDSEDEGSRRWIRAEGRDVSVKESTLDMDPETKRVTMVDGNRHDNRLRAAALKALAVIVENPGIITSSLEGDRRIPGGEKSRRSAVDFCVQQGWVERLTGAHNAKEHMPTGVMPDDFVAF